MLSNKGKIVLSGLIFSISGGVAVSAEADVQQQIEAIKAAIPKFAIPMREVGDRFQNMYFAAKGGNWALAAYMSKYMNGALKPPKLTKPDEYKTWQGFYEGGVLRPRIKRPDRQKNTSDTRG